MLKKMRSGAEVAARKKENGGGNRRSPKRNQRKMGKEEGIIMKSNWGKETKLGQMPKEMGVSTSLGKGGEGGEVALKCFFGG